MQHHDGLWRQGVEVFEQAGTVHVVGGGVVVAVGLHRETGFFKQRLVVFPAWVADGDDGVGQQLLEEVGADFQRACAAHGLGGNHTAGAQQRRLSAKQQLLHGLVVRHDAVDWQVATGGMLRHTNSFRFGNGTQEWNLPLLVAVNAHAKVHLGGPCVGVECFVEAQDWIAWCHFDSGEQAHFCGSSMGGRRDVSRSSRMH